MHHELDRTALREVCRLYGGVRAVARLAQVDDGNLSKWLRGQATLSEAKTADLLNVLGLPNGSPREDAVHEWQMKGVIRGDYALAFRLFFPSGAEAALANWSQRNFQTMIERIKDLGKTPEIVAVTDGRVRAVIRLLPNLMLQPRNMGQVLTWRGGHPRATALNIEKGSTAWCKGPLTSEEFDRGWGGTTDQEFSAQDVLSVIQEEGLSYAQAIERLRRRD